MSPVGNAARARPEVLKSLENSISHQDLWRHHLVRSTSPRTAAKPYDVVVTACLLAALLALERWDDEDEDALDRCLDVQGSSVEEGYTLAPVTRPPAPMASGVGPSAPVSTAHYQQSVDRHRFFARSTQGTAP